MKNNKILLSFLSFLFLSLNMWAQPNIQWKKSFGGLDVETAFAIQQTNDLGYIVA